MDLLVCVGGGGQHIALAVARMVRLGVWTNVPRVLVIDAEQTSLLARRLLSFADPQAGAAAQAIHPLPDPGRMFQAPLATAMAEDVFRTSFLGAPSGGGANAGGLIEEELFDLFFNEKADGVDIQKGMAAQPSVGSAVFAEMGVSHLAKELNGWLAQVDRICVASSFIGGTGAGVTHQLVRFLAESEYRNKKEMFGAFLLPWLQLPSGGQSAASDVSLVNSAKHGIQAFLQETAPRLTKGLLVGARDQRTPANPSNDETVSIYPLLAAYGLTVMIANTTGAHKDQKRGENIFALTSPSSGWQWLLECRWDTGLKGHATATIAERWSAATVVEHIVAVFTHPEAGKEFRQMSGSGLKKIGLFGGGRNWGTDFRFWAERIGKKDEVFAAQVLAQLEARMR
ncbi:MAG: hypothetical protein WCJ30_04000, partial [Deltaproteobacteria bacterium]